MQRTLKCAKMSADEAVEADILGSFKEQLSTTKNSGNHPAKTFGASITHNTLSDTRLLTYLKCNTLIVLCWTKCSVFRAYLDGPLSEIRKRGPGFLAVLEINFLLLLLEFFFTSFLCLFCGCLF